MRRFFLVLGLVCLILALLLTVVPAVLSSASEVEVFHLEPDILRFPSPAANVASADPTLVPDTLPVQAPPSAEPVASPTVAAAAQPLEAVLQQGLDGYAGVIDTYIQYYLPGDNFCTGHELSLASGNKASVLLSFDLTNIPAKFEGLNAAAVVEEARLALYAVQGKADAVSGAYALRRAWDPCLTTWNWPWQEPGADGAQDRDELPVSETASPKTPGWVEYDVTELVQTWLRDPSTNVGVLLKSFEQRWPSQHVFFSSQHPATTSRPRLTIRYQPGSLTPTATPVPPTPTPDPTATQAPTLEPTASPTVPEPTTEPENPDVPALGPRIVEIRWPARVRVGAPSRLSVTFAPETARSRVQSAHRLSIVTSLTAPSFEVVAAGTPERTLSDLEGRETWTWTLTPRLPGEQLVSLDMFFEWKGVSPSAVRQAEPGIWYQTRVLKVEDAGNTAQLQALRLGLLSAGLVSIVAAFVLRAREPKE